MKCPVDGWVDVNSQLPDKSDVYLCYASIFNGEHFFDVCSYDANKKVFLNKGRYVTITHWIGLPDPPSNK